MKATGTRIVRIHPEGKYVPIFKQELSATQADRIAAMLATWLKSDAPFLILDSGVRIERIDKIMKEETVA